MDETSETVKCPICGIERSSLVRHLRFEHGLSKIQFLKQHPDHPVVSEKMRNKFSECCKKQWDNNYYKKLYSLQSTDIKSKRRHNKHKNATTVEKRFLKSRFIYSR